MAANQKGTPKAVDAVRISDSDDARVKALLLDRAYLIEQSDKVWKDDILHFKVVDPDLNKKAIDRFRFANWVYTSVNQLAVKMLTSSLHGKKPDPSVVQSFEDYCNAIVDGNIGASISARELHERFGEERALEIVDSGRLEFWTEIQDVYRDKHSSSNGKAKPESVKAWEKYLVLLQICQLLFENLRDSRNILSEEEKNKPTLDVPFFFDKEDCSKAMSKQNLKERSGLIRVWMEYYKGL